jgi:hypothetical protein
MRGSSSVAPPKASLLARTHVWNTFDPHRLRYWAGEEGPVGSRRALKHALLAAYHGEGRNPGAHDVLLDLAQRLGLPVERARDVLEHGEFGKSPRTTRRADRAPSPQALRAARGLDRARLRIRHRACIESVDCANQSSRPTARA